MPGKIEAGAEISYYDRRLIEAERRIRYVVRYTPHADFKLSYDHEAKKYVATDGEWETRHKLASEVIDRWIARQQRKIFKGPRKRRRGEGTFNVRDEVRPPVGRGLDLDDVGS